MRKTLGLMAIACLVIALPACGKSGPCSGGGMEVDKRELPADWKALMPVPDGAIACHQAGDGMDAEYARGYELGDSPQAGFDAVRKHLVVHGWAKTAEDVVDDTFLSWEGEKGGAHLKVRVSKKVPDKGWISMSFTPAKK